MDTKCVSMHDLVCIQILPASALQDVVQYYHHYFHTAAELLTDTDRSTVASVTLGPRQRFHCRSPPTSASSSTPSIPSMVSWHYAIYLGALAAMYRGLEQTGWCTAARVDAATVLTTGRRLEKRSSSEASTFRPGGQCSGVATEAGD